jgi:peptidoglycan/xylan/chitin deacetylase (PgdA/CDA1 family)
MSTMRRLLASTFYVASLWSGHGLRRAKAQCGARILMYHGVARRELDAALFDWQLSLLRSEFEIVSLPTLLQRRAAGRLTGQEVAITFDDGVRNHVTTVYPLLQRHRAPATFFVCPGLVESGRWIWNMELRCRLRLLSRHELDALAREVGCRDGDIETIVNHAKGLAPSQRELVEEAVRGRTLQFVPTAEQVDRYAPATWEQLAGLDPALVTIGSHTLNHPILPTLPDEVLQREIRDSRRMLEQRLQRTVDLFCYPNGDNDERAQSAVRQHYAAAVTTVPGAVRDGDDAWLLPRIPAGGSRGLFMRRLYRHTA